MSTAGRLTLRTTLRPRRVASLARRARRVGLDGVLAALDREAVPCPVPGTAAGPGYTWAPADADDPGWMPQGVATTRGGGVLLVAWYSRRRRGRTAGTRVTVVDLRDRDRVRYRHVLLVRPRPWAAVTGAGRVAVHAGGLAVVGDLLYVADTVRGVRLFGLDDVLRMPDGTDVLPQTGHLHQRVLPGTAPLRWSFLGVGRVHGELSLVAGEYGRRGTRPRLVRHALDEVTGLPVAGARGRARPPQVHAQQPHRMQGVAVHDDLWVATSSTGEGSPGDLYVGAPGAFRRHRGVLPTGPEDLAWSVPGRVAWSVTEWPGRRWVFPIDVARWVRPD
ncbi:hypothetical protein [uncultured Cellulomonas sp.]|uniref:hypothetical protein n=1 Tax=uncultured Cellulomonas sp. TaxID=189682 RepID=UPI0026183A6B|nr:hypothetical protein [uncultured Cellulomonas sp.]